MYMLWNWQFLPLWAVLCTFGSFSSTERGDWFKFWFVSNTLHKVKWWRHLSNYMHHDFETLHKSRSLQLFPKFRQLSPDQSPLHGTLPMSIWFSLYTNGVYRLVVFPSKNRTPTVNSHSILIIKICNIIQLLLLSFILTYLNSHQQQGLALFSKTPKEIWLLQVPLVHSWLFLCSLHFHSNPPLFHMNSKFPLGICQMLYQSFSAFVKKIMSGSSLLSNVLSVTTVKLTQAFISLIKRDLKFKKKLLCYKLKMH